jgi:glutamate dehydrogenase
VYDRKAKSITLSPAARAALGVADDAPEEMPPNEVIRAILKAPIDLLWNGGVGTYVKHSGETNADVGDRTNDNVRISGNQVRARVVGEGGNLGFTQRGRIEFAQGGGRINTDFIDNSGGVDCSDHEVNLKILLNLAISRGELALEERNEMLEACAADVVQHVLYTNYLQAQILSQELLVSTSRLESYEDLMRQLEGEGELDREVEFLPSTEEMAERRAAGTGMARPELAVLLAYAKRSLANALLRSDLPESEYLERDIQRYFPPAVVERFDGLLPEHPLRRELNATILANDAVNSQGVTFVTRLMRETGAQAADVVRAFRIARDVTGAVARWADVESLDGLIDPVVQNELMTGVDWLVETTSRWWLVQEAGARIGTTVEDASGAFAELTAVIDRVGSDSWREEHEQHVHRLMEEGVPMPIARRHAFQSELVHGPDIISVARETGRPVEEVARVFFLLGERLDIDWLEFRLEEMPAATKWQRWAVQAMEDDVFLVRRQLAERVIDEGAGAPVEEAVEAFLERRAERVARLERFMRTLATESLTDLAQLTVALRQIRALIG